MQTDYINKCHILKDFQDSAMSQHTDFDNFIADNDIGLPLAYLNSAGLVLPTSEGIRYLENTWDSFLEVLGIQDTGFEILDDVRDKLGGRYS